MLNEGLRNANQAPFYSEAEIEAYRSGSDPVNYPNTDWKGLVLDNSGFQQRHNLSLSGGSDKVEYFINAGYLSQGSNYTEDVLSYEQYNLRSNINANIYDNFFFVNLHTKVKTFKKVFSVSFTKSSYNLTSSITFPFLL